MSNSPGVIFTMKFIYKWKIGGYDYLKYMSRPEAFQKLKHEHDEEFKDYMQYMSNSEKSDGIFDMTKDKLSEKEIDEYRVLEAESQKQGCPKYIGVTSFDNDFLKENGIITPFGLDTKKLKEIARSSISEMIQKSDKLDNDNVYWTAAIHTNTDNVHIHYAILEKERRVERKNDTIEVEAFDTLKSKVANKIIGPEHIKKLTELSRKCLLPSFNDTLKNEKSLIQLLDKLPENKKLWYYNRKEFEPYQDEVKKCVQKIILSNPKLEESYKQYVTMLDQYTEKCKRLYGDGNRHLYLNFKKNKLDDFYSRTGNAILRELKNIEEKYNSPTDSKSVLSEKETAFFKALETTEIPKTNNPSIEKSAQTQTKRQIRLKPQINKSEFIKRKSQLLAATYSLKKLVNQIDGHLDQLKREFDYEEELELAQEQYEIQMQIEYERS